MSNTEKKNVSKKGVLLLLIPIFLFGFLAGKILNSDGASDFSLIPGDSIQAQAFADRGTYNNCNGTIDTKFTLSKTRSKTVEYSINVVGGFTVDLGLLSSKIESTVGHTRGTSLSDTASAEVSVPIGHTVRIDIRWIEDLDTGKIVTSDGRALGDYQAPTNLSFDTTENDIPCETHQDTSASPDTASAGGNVLTNLPVRYVRDSLARYAFQPVFPTSPEEAVKLAYNFNGKNQDWSAYSQNFDGVEMVLVPVGCIQMGSTSDQFDYITSLKMGDPDTFRDELNGDVVCVKEPFWMDKYEVTNDQFKQFGGKAEQDSFHNDPYVPRENISWSEASDYCALTGGMLPTETQWEFAARGPDALIFPWGNDFDSTKVAYAGNETQTVEGDKYSAGASWVGALNMSGNVWEWTASIYGLFPDPEAGGDSGYRVIRGGSLFIDDSVHAANRAGAAADKWNSLRGFRCARPVN